MTTIVVLIFVIGYLAIVFEHPLKLDKTVPALGMGALAWAVISLGFHSGSMDIIDGHGHVLSAAGGMNEELEEGFIGTLIHHIGKVSEILIFLIGAMTIVELIDMHRGFTVIKDWIRTKNKRRLLWIVSLLAFFLSAIIDNLTTTIVLITILRKLIKDPELRMWYACIIIVAANAGGAWSPIGDVTTTMLWIGKRVSSIGLMEWIFLPSITCLVVPVFLMQFKSIFSGEIKEVSTPDDNSDFKLLSSSKILTIGLLAIIAVPLFKTVTHLPPYIGMMLSLAVVWMASEYVHPEEKFSPDRRILYSAHKALSRIELSSILFFLGILMAVAALETVNVNGVGSLRYAAESMERAIPNKDIVVIILGCFSAVIDNVPLVAATMGMYTEPLDAKLWHFIAYAAGTGGSMLIIGSAAGVAAMGMEKINFIWYLKKFAWIAAAGYFAGCVIFLLLESIVNGL
jgi:Na+/H+ antiporter NhaD/arsenite permease-like protein